MALWTANQPPRWKPDAVATNRGWEDPITGELLVAFRNANAAGGAPDVTYVEFVTPTKAWYKLNENIDLAVYFNEVVVVTGTPRIVGTFDATSKNWDYVSGSGTNRLVFRKVVAAAETGAVAIASPVTLNGGTIRDTALNNAVLTFTAPTVAATVDTALPTFTATANLASSYSSGDAIMLIVTSSEIVNVTGTPRIVMVLDGTNVNADYIGGSGTTTHAFQAVVPNGIVALATEVDLPANVSLNGGTIIDRAGNAMSTLTLPAASNIDTVTITDTQAPVVTTVTTIADGYYKNPSNFDVTVVFDEPVTVVGVPRIQVRIGENVRIAAYTSGSTTDTLLFRYAILAGDEGPAGQISILSPIVLNGGTIRDASTNNAVLTFTAPSTSGIIVDNTPAVISEVPPINVSPYSTGQNIVLKVKFSKPVVVTGTPRVPITINGVQRYLNYFVGSGTQQLTFMYKVVAADYAQPGQVTLSSLALNGGTIVDLGNVNANITFTMPSAASIVVN